MRSCHFLGADGALVADSCSSITPIVSKASAASVEISDRFFRVSGLSKLVEDAKSRGWLIVGTHLHADLSKVLYAGDVSRQMEVFGSKRPVLLLMGSEGEGLEDSLVRLCDFHFCVPSAVRTECNSDDVVSLNVSVAS